MMRKFMKYCAVIALILIAAGVALGVTGQTFHGGAVSLWELVDSVTHGEGSARLDAWGESIADVIDQVDYDIEDHAFFHEDHEVHSGDLEKTPLEVPEGLQSLDIEVGACILTLEESPDDGCYIEASSIKSLQAYVEQDTLHVKALNHSTGHLTKFTDSRITLYLPKDFAWDEAKLDLGAGQIVFAGLTAREASVSVGAGQIFGDFLSAEEMELEVGAGSVEIADVRVERLEADVSAGSLSFAGDIAREADLKCSMGNIELALEGEDTDYNYEIQSEMGSVVIGGQEYSGLSKKQKIQNHAPKTIEAECSMGDMVIRFL